MWPHSQRFQRSLQNKHSFEQSDLAETFQEHCYTSPVENPTCAFRGQRLFREGMEDTALAETCLPFPLMPIPSAESNSNGTSCSMCQHRAGLGSRLQAPMTHGSHVFLLHCYPGLSSKKTVSCYFSIGQYFKPPRCTHINASSLPRVVRCQ